MVRKSIPRFTKSPSLELIGLVLTKIQAFENVKNLQRNVWKTGQFQRNVQIRRVFHRLLCKFLTFLNACISVKTDPNDTKLGDFVNLGMLFLTMGINICNPIIYSHLVHNGMDSPLGPFPYRMFIFCVRMPANSKEAWPKCHVINCLLT